VKFAEALNHAGLPGVSFLPIRFTPTYSVYQGQSCNGVYILLTDRDRCNVVDVGLLMAETVYRLYPKDFDPDKMRHLLLHPPTLEAVKENKPLAEIRGLWQKDLDEFMQRRSKYLIY
jgi:uncharacterized protein YbbC (DUF1343 family)